MEQEHVSKRPVSKETYEYVSWLLLWLRNSCIDSDTRKVIRQEVERINKLYEMGL
jgi:hypothetical protein